MKRILFLVVLIIPLVIYLPGSNQFIYMTGAVYNDIAITHFPNAIFTRYSLDTWGQIPLWSNTILSGYPFAANPLSGLWYPPLGLALLLPLPFAFNLLFFLHLLWAGAGTFFFLKGQGFPPVAAITGALVFELMPKLSAQYTAGHITLICAVSWTPWLLWLYKRGLGSGSKLYTIGPGVVFGVMILADVRWAPLGAAAWVAYAVFMWYQDKQWVGLFRLVTRVVGQIGVGGLISAPLLLPLFEYAALSTRHNLSPAENMALSLPFTFLIGLFFPLTGRSHEWVLYPGALALVMTSLVLAIRKERKQNAFWFGWIVLTLILALGSNIPLMDTLASLPGFGLLRVPARWLFLTGFGFAVMTAAGIKVLSDRGSPREIRDLSHGGNPEFILWVMAFIVLSMTVGIWFIIRTIPIGMVMSCVILLVIVSAVVLWRRGILNGNITMGVLITLSILDLAGSGILGMKLRPAADVLAESQTAAQFLSQQEGLFRVYSPSYSLSQQTAAYYHLELVDGIDPLQLTAYSEFIEKASGVKNTEYSVTLPPFASSDPANDNKGAVPDVHLLGLLNTRFVVAEFPLNNDDLVFLQQFGETRIYENKQVLPRAWVQAPRPSNADAPIGTGLRSIPEITYSANWIHLSARGPGLLVLSEIAYPGWQVIIDGQKAEMKNVMGLLRGVELPEGEHQVLFIYRPMLLFVGIGIASITWVLVILYSLYRIKKYGEENVKLKLAADLQEKKV